MTTAWTASATLVATTDAINAASFVSSGAIGATLSPLLVGYAALLKGQGAGKEPFLRYCSRPSIYSARISFGNIICART
jgi:hypothetical protein